MNRNDSILQSARLGHPTGTSHAAANYGPLLEAWTRRRFLKATALAALVTPVLRATAATERIPGLPYLQSVTENSIWICWRTDTGTTPVVSYGTDPLNLNLTASGTTTTLGTNYNWHEVRLTGLTASTLYSYKIRHLNPGDTTPVESAVYRFRTTPAKATRNKNIMRFLVVGDNQLKNVPRYETILARAKRAIESKYGVPIEEAIDSMIQVGDQVDAGSLDQYRYVHLEKSAEISRSLAFHTIVGNHETSNDPNLTLYKSHFNYADLQYGALPSPDPDSYYANLVGTVLFLHLNTEKISATQTNWVTSVFNAAKDDPKVDFIVSLGHRPYQAEQYVGDISTWMRDTVVPLLSTSPKHVLTIGAHHHLYARGQTREYPTYHIISGGTAWDQYWGMSTEKDADDVTKTICNWAWQILEFDLTAKTMSVECYAEGRPPRTGVGESESITFFSAGRLIDSFHRRLTLPAPNKPAITNLQPGAAVTLPYTINSGAFTTAATGESLYSVQYQVSASAAFTVNAIDRIVDVENYFGDTGAPDYLPVNIHAALNIRAYAIAQNALANGAYYARIRHRDTNCAWSPWSDSFSFSVSGSTVVAPPTVTPDKRVYAPNPTVNLTFANAPGSKTDWIGIYPKSVATPGSGLNKGWKYLNNTTSTPATAITAGTVSISNATAFTAGTEWYAVMLASDGFTEVSARAYFYIGATPTLTVGKADYASGEPVTITYSGAPGGTKDWIGIYKAGQIPGNGTNGTSNAEKWAYVTGASGTYTFTPAADAFYYAVYMVNDGYYEISDRVVFSVGTAPARISMGSSLLPYGSPVVINFTGGAGTPKDWMGVYARGAVAGVDRLLNYTYVDGRTSGSVTISETLPAGDYTVALYINDSYTAISNSLDFTVTGGPARPEISSIAPGETGKLSITLYPKPGATHRLWHSTDMLNWSLMGTFPAEGLQMVRVVDWPAGTPAGFWKVDTL